MSFVSFAFAFFYLIAIALRFSVGRNGNGNGWLLALFFLSLVFYGWHTPAYLALLLGIGLISYFSALVVATEKGRGSRGGRFIVVASILANLAILGYFKYRAFLVGLIQNTGQALEVEHVLLPLAISFYTLQSISYIIDVFRGRISAEHRFVNFFVYLAFFPQLVAGPIVRGGQFLYQIARRRRSHLRVFLYGSYLIVQGFFLKMVVADNLGQVVDAHWAEIAEGQVPAAAAVSVVIFFSIQLLCDFMAYTDIARGIAYQLGFRLPLNFKAPLLASSFRDFWKRWHITLSEWIRDYLYIPMGGNRRGRLKMIGALIVAFAISGIWHGANSTFVVWGLIHGCLICIEACTRRRQRSTHRNGGPSCFQRSRQVGRIILGWIIVQSCWILSLIYFRSSNIDQANEMITRLIQHDFSQSEYTGMDQIQFAWIFCIPVVILHLRQWMRERGWWDRHYPAEHAFFAGFMLVSLFIFYAPSTTFIYFQF